MAEKQHDGALGAAYSAKSPQEVASLYDSWAETYDAEMARAGYRHPSICLALFARHVPRGAAPVLDAGAGTGLVGEWLGIVGYGDVEGLDISKGMLAVAAAKNIYTKLHEGALGQKLPFEDGHFAGIACAGVFTTGHVGAEGIDELVRICRPGGAIVLTVKTTLWQPDFESKIGRLEKAGLVSVIEQTEPYVSMPGDEATVPSVAVVLRVS